MAMRGFAIPARTANLLYIGLKGLGQIVVNDTSDIWFVQAHAKRYCGHNDAQAATHEGVLDALTLGR